MKENKIRESISITLNDEVLELLEKFCKKENRSRSNAIEVIVANYLKDEK